MAGGIEPSLSALSVFPAGATSAALAVRAGIMRQRNVLAFRFVVGGSVDRLRLPERARDPRRLDRLWRRTCFEAFLAPVGGSAYWELNVSPSGDWNAYRFDAYRHGMSPDDRLQAPATTFERASCGTLTLRISLDASAVMELVSGPLDVGLASVLEDDTGALSYWALRHMGEQPDFHRRESFVVTVGA